MKAMTKIFGIVLAVLAVGCLGYHEVSSNEATATIEAKIGCEFPPNVEVRTARMDYRSSVSFIGRLDVSDEQLQAFLGSFKPRIELHPYGHPWGKTPEPVSKGIEWWDAHSIENPLSGRLDSSDLEFVISVTEVDGLSKVHFKVSWE